MEAKIESYTNKITTEYKKENVRNEFDIYIRDNWEKSEVNASAAKAIKQQNAKAGIFEYNGGMVR
ncbi:TPA: hypothetical protein ACQ301_003531 [Yersinia enterocolitica]